MRPYEPTWRQLRSAFTAARSLAQAFSRYQYPETSLPGMTPQQALEHLTWGCEARYPEGLLTRCARRRHELRLIGGPAPPVPDCHSIFAGAQPGQCPVPGRGSAANSPPNLLCSGHPSIDPGAMTCCSSGSSARSAGAANRCRFRRHERRRSSCSGSWGLRSEPCHCARR